MRGSENVSPDWGPDGRIAFSSRRDGRYHICTIDPSTGRGEQHTGDNADHEEPSWARDARHIVYVRTVVYHADLYVLDTLGDPEVRLTTFQGDWYSPAWSPR
jgi:Tol biopolymer transport system component